MAGGWNWLVVVGGPAPALARQFRAAEHAGDLAAEAAALEWSLVTIDLVRRNI